MTKRGYHHGNLRQALVEAALALIAERGPQGFSLSEAAKQAEEVNEALAKDNQLRMALQLVKGLPRFKDVQ